MVHDRDMNNQPEAPPPRRTAPYRVLGSYAKAAEPVSSAPAEEDPMAWADLEEFGGTRKSLEPSTAPVVPKALTAQEVRQQLEELAELDGRMHEATLEKRSKKGMMDTISWLKRHNQETTANDSGTAKARRKRSTSFVRSMLDYIHVGGRHNVPAATTAANPHDNNAMNEDSGDLTAPWAQEALQCDWTEIGFRLLNAALLEDVARVRQVIESGDLVGAAPQAKVALAKWLRLFDQHVNHVVTLKDYLLDERTLLAGVGYKVTTQYHIYREALSVALEQTHGESRDLGADILVAFADLEQTLADEVEAVKEVLSQTLSEPQEYEALSQVFRHICEEESCGIILAKLLGWMKNHLDEADIQRFLGLFDADVKDKIAGDWMRHYASYLELLDTFSVNFDGPMAYFT